ncbi:YobA family protein [Paenibacillus sp. PR3]|uniref:YobA family protein n=1 Tax=Paenibacillus terricola TaxID=2763503 RepID=A0ABR8MSW0_9BACL|nr:DUF3221 domain-containing protein [Paenibacillus terricola]MBD3919008.1 YobA family protein [Paenibacillus terricola]
MNVAGYVVKRSITGLSILCIIALMITSCGVRKESNGSVESEVNPALVGYVTKMDDRRALVVTPISRTINATGKEFYDAIWVSNMPSNIEIGQYVQVWFQGGIETSYPGGGVASKVTISDTNKPAAAKLTQEEVIRKALLDKDIANVNILVISEVTYDEQTAMWTLRYKSAAITDGELEEYKIQIPDK